MNEKDAKQRQSLSEEDYNERKNYIETSPNGIMISS